MGIEEITHQTNSVNHLAFKIPFEILYFYGTTNQILNDIKVFALMSVGGKKMNIILQNIHTQNICTHLFLVMYILIE